MMKLWTMMKLWKMLEALYSSLFVDITRLDRYLADVE